MMTYIKDGVCLTHVQAMCAIFTIVPGVLHEYGYDAVITSGIEGEHKRASLHYAGCALDFRLRDVPENAREGIRKEIAGRLGGEFDVTLSPLNFHVEWQPKVGVNS